MLVNNLSAWSELAFIQFIRQSSLLYPTLSALHILGIAILIGHVLLLDLYLLGILRQRSIQNLFTLLSRQAAIGLLLAAVTGILLFSVQPNHYIVNKAFQIKILLLITAMLNILWIHQSKAWLQAKQSAIISFSIRLAAALSLLLWLAILIAGRWIAFI